MAGKGGKWWSQQLRRPEWAEFRAIVLAAKGRVCSDCGRESRSPNVHHDGYRPDALPWEYALSEVRILCGDCHGAVHGYRNELDDFINELDGDSLTAFLESVRLATPRGEEEDFPIHKRVYHFVKNECWRILAQQWLIEQCGGQDLYYEARNRLLSLSKESLDCWACAVDLLKQIPTADRLEVLRNLVCHVQKLKNKIDREDDTLGTCSLGDAAEEAVRQLERGR